jgi:hypothetical protein
MKNISTSIQAIIVVFGILIAVAALVAFPVKWLWNGCLVPAVSFANEITAYQAVGLVILMGLLFPKGKIESKK